MKELIEQYLEQRNSLIETIKNNLFNYLKPIFEKYPFVESIGWTQYTPFFNDGDTCEFRCNLSYLIINGSDFTDHISYISNYRINRGERLESEKSELQLAGEEFLSILEQIPDDIMKDLFGDHAEITIKNSGEIIVDEYDHD